MTQIHIFSIGKWKKGPEQALYDHFHARMKWQIVLHQMDDKAASFLTPDQVRDNQAEKLLPLLAKTPLAYRIALDEKGQQLSSLQLAGQFQQCFNQSLIPTFLIGGDHGLRQDIVKNAHLTLSFGKVTWPHLLVLGLLAEQLYRAQQILAGHPYHRQS